MQTLRERLSALRGSDLSFLRSSGLLAIGFAVARALGLGFSLLLGRALPVEEYGYVTAGLFIAGLLGIATQPFVQHSWARAISVHRTQEVQLNRIVSSGTALLIVLTILSLALSIPVLLLTNSLNLGVIVAFLGVTLFYTYNGLVRGFESSWRLVAVFVGSNLLQLLAIFVVYYLLNSSSPLPALLIYGCSYLPPVLYLLVYYPLPMRPTAQDVDRHTIITLAKTTVPMWVSHIAFTFSYGFDVVLLSRYWGASAVGAYSMAKTLSFVFDFVPNGISTIIMPRIAASTTGRRRLVTLSIGATMSVQIIFAICFLLLYQPLVTWLFGVDYLVPPLTVLLMVVAALLWGIHNILANALIGANQAGIEGINRLIIVGTLYGAGIVLVPTLATTGVALADLITSLIAVATIPLLRHWRRSLSNRRNEAQP
ncbi:MAG: oligosaccharide flippase family protein [Anaerolineae bacterium]|nr:oligosaccharide flippase family protein [Anaerolineae bacterium]